MIEYFRFQFEAILLRSIRMNYNEDDRNIFLGECVCDRSQNFGLEAIKSLRKGGDRK